MESRWPQSRGADAPSTGGAVQLRGRSAAGPTHPKPAGPCNCGAVRVRGHAYPKKHTLVVAVELRGRRTLNRRGRAPAGPNRCGAANLQGGRTLNRRGHAVAGPHRCGAGTDPKPVGPCSYGAVRVRGHANPKSHTMVCSPGRHSVAGPTHPKPAGPCIYDAAPLRGRQTLNRRGQKAAFSSPRA